MDFVLFPFYAPLLHSSELCQWMSVTGEELCSLVPALALALALP